MFNVEREPQTLAEEKLAGQNVFSSCIRELLCKPDQRIVVSPPKYIMLCSTLYSLPNAWIMTFGLATEE